MALALCSSACVSYFCGGNSCYCCEVVRLYKDAKKNKKNLSTAVVPSSHCLNCLRGGGELVSKFTDGLADAPRRHTHAFGRGGGVLEEHQRPWWPVRCPARSEVKDGGVGGCLRWRAEPTARLCSRCNNAERLGSGSSRACLLEPSNPRELSQPGASRASPTRREPQPAEPLCIRVSLSFLIF